MAPSPRFGCQVAAFLLLLLCAGSNSAFAAEESGFDNSDCFICHEDSSLVREEGPEAGALLYVAPATYEKSVHGEMACTNCHSSLNQDEHPDGERSKAVSCVDCHEQEEKAFHSSIHGAAHAMGDQVAATCVDCHGTHDMLPSNDPTSRTYKLNIPSMCAKCHTNETITSGNRIRDPKAAEHYRDSMHGHALVDLGLIVAPSCVDCHGVHDIRPSMVKGSTINRENVANTCGECHVKVEEIYNQSIHGQKLVEGDPEAPVCIDCHTSHEIEDPLGTHFKAVSDLKCGKCHEEQFDNYHETYHGKAMRLRDPSEASEVAACFDCHGYHDILPRDNPDSHISEANITQTCANCHEGANDSFAQYIAHANHYDKENYPQLYWTFMFMTALLLGVFTLFGLHTAFWLFRSAYLYWTDSKTFREAKTSTQKGGEWFTRFSPFERFLHGMVVTSFLLLVITGMPLKFSGSNWSKALFDLIGGPDVARALHHFGAIVTFAYFGMHLCALLKKAWKGRRSIVDPEKGRVTWAQCIKIFFGPDSMLPSKKDWHEFVNHQKWFFGKAPKPQFDRWTYWEKFDYFSVFWGVAIIGFSGLIMWFPVFFSQFLPGWVINVALVIHSDEALLAAGFIFTVHFFNTHLRLEKFPMDTVIFSGRISKAEMLHERKGWYERLEKSGKLDDHRIRDEWFRWKVIARTFGYIFFGTGVILLLCIVYAMFKQLFLGGH